jgi:hypothetical protein
VVVVPEDIAVVVDQEAVLPPAQHMELIKQPRLGLVAVVAGAVEMEIAGLSTIMILMVEAE